jgi:hypothetical protein
VQSPVHFKQNGEYADKPLPILVTQRGVIVKFQRGRAVTDVVAIQAPLLPLFGFTKIIIVSI